MVIPWGIEPPDPLIKSQMWIHEIIKYLQALLESSAFFIRQIYDSDSLMFDYDPTGKFTVKRKTDKQLTACQ